jgi:hypothetical protein
VTAKTPEALRALQEKIPEGIRDLAISVIHNDREGARQLQHAVQVLADEAKSLDPRLVTEQIRERQSRLAELRRQIESIDGKFQRIAERNLARVAYRGSDISPMDLARAVAEQRAAYGWLSDSLTFDPQYAPKFTDDEIDEARRLRRLLANDLCYTTDALPDPDALPELPRVIAAHGELGRVEEIEAASRAGRIPYMEPDPDAARWLCDWIVGFDFHERDQEGTLASRHLPPIALPNRNRASSAEGAQRSTPGVDRDSSRGSGIRPVGA